MFWKCCVVEDLMLRSALYREPSMSCHSWLRGKVVADISNIDTLDSQPCGHESSAQSSYDDASTMSLEHSSPSSSSPLSKGLLAESLDIAIYGDVYERLATSWVP